MRFHHVLALLAVVAVGACSSELTAPAAPDDPITFAQADTADAIRPAPIYSEEECRVPDPPAGTIPWSNSAPPLETYCAAFWVVQGLKDQTLALGFADDVDVKARWFLRLFIPEDAVFVDDDGRPVANGSVVRVTVAVHPTLYAVRFGPHGSGFHGARQAVLRLNYSWAELSTGDAKDLVIYYQADEEDAWRPELTAVDRKGKFVYTWLHHFSNYAVAW